MNADSNNRTIRAYVTGPMFDERPKAIRSLRLGDLIQLVRQPDNAVDPNAIQLLTLDNAIIGFLPRQIAAWLAPFIDNSDAKIVAEVIELHVEVITGTLRAQVAFSVPEVWLEIADEKEDNRKGRIEFCVEHTRSNFYVLANCDGERVQLLTDILKANDLPPIRVGFTTWDAKDGKRYDWYFKLGDGSRHTVESVQRLLKNRLGPIAVETSQNSFSNIQQAIRNELQVLRKRLERAQSDLTMAWQLGEETESRLKQEAAFLWQQIDSKERQAAEIEQEHRNTQAKLRQFDHWRLADKGHQESRPTISDGLRDMIEEHIAPSLTVSQVLRLISGLANGNLVVLDSAWKSADDAELFRHSRRLFDLLYRLAFEFRPAMMINKGMDAGKSIFGGDFAEMESSTTMNSPACRKARTFRYKNEDTVMVMHLKIGVGISVVDCLRIHFHWDADAQKIIIGHCGAHLPTA